MYGMGVGGGGVEGFKMDIEVQAKRRNRGSKVLLKSMAYISKNRCAEAGI
jgi:hypothetical protein